MSVGSVIGLAIAALCCFLMSLYFLTRVLQGKSNLGSNAFGAVLLAGMGVGISTVAAS
jgi:hypothetical protein